MKKRNSIYSALSLCQAAVLLVLIGGCSETGAEDNSSVTPSTTPQTGVVSSGQTQVANNAQTQLDNNSSNGAAFEPGSTFTSPTVGVSITMPTDITAQFNSNAGLLGFGNTQNTIGGFVFGGTSGGLTAGEGRVASSILKQFDLTVQQIFTQEVIPQESLSNVFHVKNANEADVLMQLEVRMGPAGNYVIVLGNASFNDEVALNEVVTQMANSISFTTPATPTLTVDLRGTTHEFNSSSSNTFEGTGSLTGGTESILLVCSDSRYAFSSTSSTFASFNDGVGSGSSEQTQHGGLMASHFDFSGNQLIELRSQQGGTFVFNVTALNGLIFIDEDGYTTTSNSEPADCAG